MNIEAYEAILDSVPSPIVFVDNDHVIRFLNKAARQRYYERRGHSALIGKSLFDCHAPPSQEQVVAFHNRLMAGEDEIFLKVNKDGERVTVVRVRDLDGQLIGYYERFERTIEPGAEGDE